MIVNVVINMHFLLPIRQLTLGLEKLMVETMSIFWVDLVYMLRSRDRVLLQGSRG